MARLSCTKVSLQARHVDQRLRRSADTVVPVCAHAQRKYPAPESWIPAPIRALRLRPSQPGNHSAGSLSPTSRWQRRSSNWQADENADCTRSQNTSDVIENASRRGLVPDCGVRRVSLRACLSSESDSRRLHRPAPRLQRSLEDQKFSSPLRESTPSQQHAAE